MSRGKKLTRRQADKKWRKAAAKSGVVALHRDIVATKWTKKDQVKHENRLLGLKRKPSEGRILTREEIDDLMKTSGR